MMRRTHKAIWFALWLLLLSGDLGLAQSSPPEPAPVEAIDVRFQRLVENQASFVREDQGSRLLFTVSDKTLKALLAPLHEGDRLTLEVTQPATLHDVSVQYVLVSRVERILAMALSGLGLVGLVWLLLRRSPSALIVGYDGRYSNSKFQVAAWFAVLMVTYVAALCLRFAKGGSELLGCVGIPDNLMFLSGLSAFTFAAAKGITTAKADAAQAAAANVPPHAAPLAQPLPMKTQAQPHQCRFFQNLLSNDQNRPDLGDTQMLIVTLLAMGLYLAQAFKFLGSIPLVQAVVLPDVDSTMLTLLGVSQGAYLTKKGMGRVGES